MPFIIIMIQNSPTRIIFVNTYQTYALEILCQVFSTNTCIYIATYSLIQGVWYVHALLRSFMYLYISGVSLRRLNMPLVKLSLTRLAFKAGHLYHASCMSINGTFSKFNFSFLVP